MRKSNLADRVMRRIAQTVPAGFVPANSTELSPDGTPMEADKLVAEGFHAIPVTLYTNGSVHYFMLQSGGQQFWLPLRAD